MAKVIRACFVGIETKILKTSFVDSQKTHFKKASFSFRKLFSRKSNKHVF